MAFANDSAIEVEDLALKPAGPGTSASLRPVAAVVPLSVQREAVSPSPVTAPIAVEPKTDVVDTREAITDDVCVAHSGSDLPASLPDYLDQVEREVICRALAKTHFNRTQAAELLGISFRQLRYRMQRLAIHEPES